MAGRLLLIGESNNDLTELKITFEALGLTVEIAPDGLAGLEKGSEFQPDLVVTEILTNRLSGFELASRIGSGAAGFVAPVIFYTEFYRDEKARREVLAKYGAIQYCVRPFQKETLKKSVTAHFQDFLSKLPSVPIAERPEPAGSAPEVNTVIPQLSRAAAATEQKPTNPLPGRSIQPGKPGGLSGEVPSRFRAFSPAGHPPVSEVAEPEVAVSGTVTVKPEKQPVVMDTTMTAPQAATERSPAKDSKPQERDLLLSVEAPSWIERMLQSPPLRIAAVVIIAGLALYLARDQFRGGNKEASIPSETPISAQPSPPPAAALEPPTTVASSTPTAEESVAEAESRTETEPVKPLDASIAEQPAKRNSFKSPDAADSGAARDRSPALSIQDVTGRGRGPALTKMKPVLLSPDVLSSLRAKAVVVRVVIDSAGKVIGVTPLNQEGSEVSIPADALAAIQQWEFSRSRRRGSGEAVKYFSLKVR